MAASLLQRSKVISFFGTFKKTKDVITLTPSRSIMTSKARLEKVMGDLQKNPYFEKYAQKIAKLQQTSPEEFLARIEEKEREIKKEKVFSRSSKATRNMNRSWSITSHLWRTNMIHKQCVVKRYSHKVPEYKYVTTPIFYVNSVPHIGHLYTAVVADAISRFNLMQGHVTLLNTGTDEHGNKVLEAAKSFNLPTDEYCKRVSRKFRDMCDTFEIGYTSFIRTTDPLHRETVYNFWNVLEERNHIYKGKYSGWYCASDEAFLSNQDLVEKKTESGEIIKVSAESGHPVEWTEEDNYKFRLSAFEDDLKHWLKDEKVVQPTNFHKILTQLIESGFCQTDLSISRPVSRVPWGMPTPNDQNQTIYVWLDALVNYLTSLGYPDEKFKKFWPPAVQVIGKDILRFHGIYWPAFLIAAGLEPPQTLLCHSHWTVEHEKMSKSKGNVVSPFQAAEQFTTEGMRYFLLRDSVPHNDSDYSAERVLNILNSELADTLGNLVSRCTGKAVNPKGEIPSVAIYGKVLKSGTAEVLRKNMEKLGDVAKEHYESFYLHHVADAAMSTLRSANVMVDHHKPWQLRKEVHDENAQAELKSVISLALEAARISAIVLFPIVPMLSTHLLDFLNVSIYARNWEDAQPKYLKSAASADSEQFGDKNRIVFPKITLKA